MLYPELLNLDAPPAPTEPLANLDAPPEPTEPLANLDRSGATADLDGTLDAAEYPKMRQPWKNRNN